MKLSAKVISSPGRTDKFPPPLMRFLRSNAGSRSRRSRSSPMFVRKNKNNNTTIETQEPSSPKVTCMGQVRARRSSSKQASVTKRDRALPPPHPPPTRCRCWWIRKPGPCHCRPVWPKWAFFRRRKQPTVTKLKEDSTKSESNFQVRSCEDEESVYEERVSVSGGDNNNNGFASCTPPRNALLLTRCRSAPYRSSSLASRFWGSPIKSEEETESSSVDNDKPTSISDEEGKRESQLEPKLGFLKEFEEKINSITNSENVEGGESVVEARPVVLTRCKSEPARTGHRFDPEVNNLWKKRRLAFADTFSPLHIISG